MGRLCREHDIVFIVDTAQTAGVIPINMKEMNIDGWSRSPGTKH